MYVMFVLVVTGGLMATAQLAPIAKDYYVDQYPVHILFWTFTALGWAAVIDRITNGITRPICGWISDYLGRENTMLVIFTIEGLGILAMAKFGNQPLLFVILTGLVFFGWGEIYSLFPATSRDHFGQKYATTNYGMLYTAKGTGALLIPFGPVLAATHGWGFVLMLAAIANFAAAALAIFVLKPVRRWEVKRNQELGDAAPGEPAPPLVQPIPAGAT
jgi:OFA family oxalate/formate antiporter-like MFS transporter